MFIYAGVIKLAIILISSRMHYSSYLLTSNSILSPTKNFDDRNNIAVGKVLKVLDFTEEDDKIFTSVNIAAVPFVVAQFTSYLSVYYV